MLGTNTGKVMKQISEFNYTWLGFALPNNVINVVELILTLCKSEGDQEYAYFSLITNTKKLLLVTFCDLTATVVKWDGTGRHWTS